jgi:hypothetical protein
MLHDVIGYAAIGSGAIHALQSMIGFQHNAGAEFSETAFRVFASKRRAEAAPGVGRDTDMAVIFSQGTYKFSDDELREFEGVYDDFVSLTDEALTQRLEAFKLRNAVDDQGGEEGGELEQHGQERQDEPAADAAT